MPWKKDDKGALALDDKGDPIFIQDGDGKEVSVNFVAMTAKLQEANKGEQKYRLKLADLEKRVEPVKDVADLSALVKDHDDLKAENSRLKENTDASKIEEKIQAAKIQIEKAWQDKEKTWTVQLEEQKKQMAQAAEEAMALKGEIHRQSIRAMFNESPFVKEKCNLSPSLMFELFGGKAKIGENSAFNGLDPASGEVMLGVDGKPMSFDAWIFKAIEAHPDGKSILKGSEWSNPGGSPLSKTHGAANPWLKATFNRTQQNAVYKNNPELAKQMMAAAGLTPPDNI